MKRSFMWSAACAVTLGLCAAAFAQDSFDLTDSNLGVERTFVVTMGTANTNDPLVVFEGQIDSTLNITSAYHEVSGSYLATLQLLAQIRLFDELPASNEVGDVQGAVVALRSPPLAETGLYYVWAASNSVMTWLPLNGTNGTQFGVNNYETNYVTFVFNYPTNDDPVTYQVFIGDETASEMEPSQSYTSLTSETNGISEVSLLGVGGLREIGSASGAPGPLSSSIGLFVYFASNSVMANVYTAGERGTDPIKIYAWIDGAWVLVGTIDNVYGEGDHKYLVLLSGLVPGQSYRFKVIDEVGREYVLSQPVEVKTISVGEAYVETVVGLEMQMLNVTFNTEQGRRYQVLVSESLSAPLSLWTVEDVYLDSIGALTNVFTAAEGAQTQVRIPVNRNKAFFKIIMLED